MINQANITSFADEEVSEVDTTVILEPKEAKEAGVPSFRAHWNIFLPTIVIFISYAIAWVILSNTGKSDTYLARMFIIVMAIGVPLLGFYAFLRFETICIQVRDGHVICHPGWPKELPVDVPVHLIESVEVKHDVFGKIFNSAKVVLNLKDGESIIISDLRDSEGAKKAIEEAIA